jgi:hypothetical protein
MAADQHTAHLLAPDGVTAVRFERDGPRWSNVDPMTLTLPVFLDFGGGITLHAGESIRTAYTWTWRLEP